MLTDLYRFRTLLTAAVCAFSCTWISPTVAAPSDLTVKVQIVDGEIRADVSLFVRASQQRAWDVITDYERAPEFMPDVQSSRIVSRSGDTIRVQQKDQVHFGPFTIPVDSVKDVRLIAPTRTESRQVSGSLKQYESTTELIPTAGGTRIVYRSVAVAGSALAAFATESRVKRETEDRFKQVRAEILRRENIATAQ